jgi:hypothetical protein
MIIFILHKLTADQIKVPDMIGCLTYAEFLLTIQLVAAQYNSIHRSVKAEFYQNAQLKIDKTPEAQIALCLHTSPPRACAQPLPKENLISGEGEWVTS